MTERDRITTTLIPARVRLFQPTQRPVTTRGEWVETSWGRCRVDGRLGQRHADVYEALLFVADQWAIGEDGGAWLLVDPAKVRRRIARGQHSTARIQEWVAELMQAVVWIRAASLGVVEESVLLSDRQDADHLPDHPGKVVRSGERRLWRVRLGSATVFLLQHDLPLSYDPGPITRLAHGISQAIARHVLTHKVLPVGGWTVDGLIGAVAGPLAGSDRRNARRNLRADAEGLRAIGISIDGDRVTRVLQRPGGVLQRPGGVPQRPGVCRLGPGRSGSFRPIQGPEPAALEAAGQAKRPAVAGPTQKNPACNGPAETAGLRAVAAGSHR
ncbi:hypothetical protein GALL_312060 [mine drainage metagenome]|uniref:Uncharacterized protein n=1 Tax=mine drainage metagenome TaxID=410659 RepID=A0A1J5RBA7_9ZZZZ